MVLVFSEAPIAEVIKFTFKLLYLSLYRNCLDVCLSCPVWRQYVLISCCRCITKCLDAKALKCQRHLMFLFLWNELLPLVSNPTWLCKFGKYLSLLLRILTWFSNRIHNVRMAWGNTHQGWTVIISLSVFALVSGSYRRVFQYRGKNSHLF